MQVQPKLRIGMVLYPTQGGSGIVAAELGKRLASRGHMVHFISYRLPHSLDLETMPRLAHFHLVNVPPYPLFDFPPVVSALSSTIFKVAREARLDLIHSHYAIPHAIAAFLAKEMLVEDAGSKGIRVSTITTIHGTDVTVTGADQAYYPTTSFSLRQSNGITAVSSYLKKIAVDRFRLAESGIKVIYNFVDARIYKRYSNPQLRGQFAKPGEKIICHVSNFRPIKRIGDILRAFRLIQAVVPSRLLLIGEGPESEEMKSLAAELGLQNKVYFLGNRRDVYRFLAIADLFLLASQSEGLSLAALEAMSCKVPVVATNVGGIPEVVSEGKTGFLVEVGNFQALARQSLVILRDREMNIEMGNSARRVVRQKFSPQKNVSQYEKYYRFVLGV